MNEGSETPTDELTPADGEPCPAPFAEQRWLSVGALPDDPDSTQFQAAIADLKPLYSDRRSFNFMVCDNLAMRGRRPHTDLVLRIARRGNKADVATDVDAWYSGLHARFAVQRMGIPEAVRVQANSVFEKLWSIACSEIALPLQGQIDAASSRESALANELALVRDRAQALEASHAEATAASAEQLARLAMERDDLVRAAKEREQELTSRIESLTSQASDERNALTARLEQERLRHQEEAASAAQLLQRTLEELSQARARIDSMVRESNELARARALSQAEEAVALRQAQSEAVAAREHLAESQIQQARLEARSVAAVERVEQLQSTIADLRQQVAHLAAKDAQSPVKDHAARKSGKRQ